MISFNSCCGVSMGKYTQKFVDSIRATKAPNFYREPYQSYMTATEWRNVEMARELAQHLSDGKSLFHFPYFRQIVGIWRVTYNAYRASRQYHSPWQILTSEYGVMDAFVAFFSTLEYLPKGLISLGLAPFLKRQNNTEMQAALASYVSKYANGLETVPFYDSPYAEDRLSLKRAYQQATTHTWTDWLSWKLMSTELFVRRWISYPLSYWFHSDSNVVSPTTEVIVKYKVGAINEDDAKLAFAMQLGHLEETQAAIVGDDLYARVKSGSLYYVYARLSVSRYKAFQETLQALDNEGISLRRIAGQDHVQVKCLVDEADTNILTTKIEKMASTTNSKYLYRYTNDVTPGRHFCFFDVPTKKLAETVRALEADCEVSFIHNF